MKKIVCLLLSLCLWAGVCVPAFPALAADGDIRPYTVSGDFDGKQLILLSVTPVFPSLVLFALCLFISTFSHKTKKMLGICIGIVFVSYVLNVISQMGSSVDFLKFFSVFTLADSRNVILNVRLDAALAIISFVISLAFLVFSVIRYNKKELI